MHWRGGWNGWQSSNGYGYYLAAALLACAGYSAPAYYPPPAYGYYYPEPVGRGLNFRIPLALTRTSLELRMTRHSRGASFL